MDVKALRDELNKLIEEGKGELPILILNGDGYYEESDGIGYDRYKNGYTVY